MSLAVLHSRALRGMEAPVVNVEVNLSNGLPGITIVGLPDAEVRESKDRVRAALQNAGFDIPQRRVTINLAPADLPKASGRFDLPIAIGILAASHQLPLREMDRYEFAGELSLSGELRPIRGALAMAVAMQQAKAPRAFILPSANADEAALASGASILPAATLLDVARHFMRSGDAVRLVPHASTAELALPVWPDLAEVKGQAAAKRALEIAAAGGHSVLMLGPPGAGKTMLANRFPGLLPPMLDTEALEAAAVHSISGSFHASQWKVRPFRAPHHTASAAALVGGGSSIHPGEISLAHCGVLFLDELPEFDRRVLEVLRQPIESGRVTIARAEHHADLPARFQLLAAMNPCPCGYFGDSRCHCPPERVQRYQHRVSGPLLDRIDIHLHINALPPAHLASMREGESSADIAVRVAAAAQRQLARQGKLNRALSPRETDRYCKPDAEGELALRGAMATFDWSARAYHRVLRLARSVADLRASEQVASCDVNEAIEFRRGLYQRPRDAA